MSKVITKEYSTTHHVKTWSLLIATLVLIFASVGYYYLINEDKINQEFIERFSTIQTITDDKTLDKLDIDKEITEIDKEVNSINESDLTVDNLNDDSIGLE